DSDRFWFEKPDMFTSDERIIIRNTTLRDIITRNINSSTHFPQNIWSVQPQMVLNNSDDINYPTKISTWSQYIVSYRVDMAYVYFKVQLQTSDGNGWFGMGFDPEDEGMKGAEFIIGIVTDGNVTLGNYHADVGGYHPPLRDSNQDPTLIPKFSMSNKKAVTVEFRRPLNPPGRKRITHGDMKYSTEALLTSKDTTFNNYSSVLAKYINHLQREPEPRRKMSAAKFIDNINKMVSMVIGKVNERVNEKGHLTQDRRSPCQNLECNPVEIDTKSIKFHRYRLTSKKMINANCEYPVMRFTFTKIHQAEKDVYAEKFLPGHYIEVQSRVNGQIVIRSYTPLEGYEIQVRGPFDACDRCKSYLAPTSLNSRLSVLPSAKPHTPYARLTETLSTAKTSLINPNSPDGCWDELYMIAENDTNKYRRMHLLFGNRKIEDVIDGILLEDLALSSQGQLTVTFCLSEPPSDWEGLKGRINKRIIRDWMNLMQGLSLKTPNETQTNILHSHSIRRDHETQTNILHSHSIRRDHETQTNTLHSPSIRRDHETQTNILHSHSILRDPNENRWSLSSTSNHEPPFMKSHEIPPMSPLRQYNTVSVHTLSREFALFIQPENQIYEDHINEMEPYLEPYLEPKASSKKSRMLSIDPDLANSKNGDNLTHGKIIVSGPYGMLVAVEQDLLEMGFNDD
ncbi:199_t:CDS:2, partial [Racocetra fulgida]